MEQKYFTESMPLLTLNHSYEACGDPEALISTTNFEKCGGKTNFGWQECYILKTHHEFPYTGKN